MEEAHGVATDLAAGSFAGAAGIVVGQPLDTVKVRMQTSTSNCFSRFSAVAADILRHEGVFGFFKGIMPPMLGAAAYTVRCFLRVGKNY